MSSMYYFRNYKLVKGLLLPITFPHIFHFTIIIILDLYELKWIDLKILTHIKELIPCAINALEVTEDVTSASCQTDSVM